MASRVHEPAIENITAALKGLRTRNGLTVKRLAGTTLPLVALDDLDLVRQVGLTQGVSREEAIVAAVRGAARRLEPPRRLIVDAALSLGLLVDVAGVSEADRSGLYADDLATRRETTAKRWAGLLRAMGVASPPDAPTARSLRAELEVEAFNDLAASLLDASPLDAASNDVDLAGDQGRARVVVVGAAVMDYYLEVEHFAKPDTSVQARSFTITPGGKGLNQAVAAARLGMDVHLVAAVGDDRAGTDIKAYLEREGVNTDLVKVVSGAWTPVTVILVAEDGRTTTVGWRNEAVVALHPNDLASRAVRSHVDAADIVLVTFELPFDTLQAMLTAAGRAGGPTTIVTASPPYAGAQLSQHSFRQVDVLIGTHWELASLLPAASTGTDVEELAAQLRILGVSAVAVAEAFRCRFRSDDLRTDVGPYPTAYADAPGARDAFAAALTVGLSQTGGELAEDGLAWATAAMAAAQSQVGVAHDMPLRGDIERVLEIAAEQAGASDD